MIPPSPNNETIRFNCPNCEYCSSSKTGLRDHIKYEHGSVRTYKCQDCEFETSRPNYMKQHIESKHSGRHMCSECDASIGSIKNLRKHVRNIHGKNRKLYL